MPQIRLLNQSSRARRSLMTLGCYFDPSENLVSTDSLIVRNGNISTGGTRIDNVPVQWYQQGVRHPNGAIKYARCSFLADLAANEDVVLDLRKGTANPAVPSFTLYPNMQAMLAATRFDFIVGGTAHAFSLDGTNVAQGLVILEQGVVYQRYKLFGRHNINTDLWFELVYDVANNDPHVRFWFSYGYSSARVDTGRNGSPPTFPITNNIMLAIRGVTNSTIYDSDLRVNNVVTVTPTPGMNFNRFVLFSPANALTTWGQPNPVRLAWGQSMMFRGCLSYEDATSANSLAHMEVANRALACATNWQNNNPPVFQMPDRPSYIATAAEGDTRADAIVTQSLEGHLRRSSPTYRGPLNWIHWGSNPASGGQGAQGFRGYAFAPMRGWPWLLTGYPTFLSATHMQVESQYLRNANWRTPNGDYLTRLQILRPLGTQSGARGLIWWGTYYSGSDTYLGANATIPEGLRTPNPLGELSGPDREHWMNVFELITAYTSMDYAAVNLIENIQSVLYSASLTTTSGNGTIDGPGTERDVGRTFYVGSGIYELTDDPDVLLTLVGRLVSFLNVYWANDAPTNSRFLSNDVINHLHYLRIHPPGNRSGELLNFRSVRPWENALMIFGIQAAFNVLSRSESYAAAFARGDYDEHMRLARNTAASIMMHGLVDATSNYQVLILEIGSYGPSWINMRAADWPLGAEVTSPSGARGEIMHVIAHDNHGVPDRAEIWLRNCTGQFYTTSGQNSRPGGGTETITVTSTGRTGRVYHRVHWYSCVCIEPGDVSVPSTNNSTGTAPTIEQLFAVRSSQIQERGSGAAHPHGYVQVSRWYAPYTEWYLPAAVMALESARRGLYSPPSSNAIVEAKVTRFLDYMRGDGGSWSSDWYENFKAYATIGYGDAGETGNNTGGIHAIYYAISPPRAGCVVNDGDASGSVSSVSATGTQTSSAQARAIARQVRLITTTATNSVFRAQVFTLRSVAGEHQVSGGSAPTVVNASVSSTSSNVPTAGVYTSNPTTENDLSVILFMKMTDSIPGYAIQYSQYTYQTLVTSITIPTVVTGPGEVPLSTLYPSLFPAPDEPTFVQGTQDKLGE